MSIVIYIGIFLAVFLSLLILVKRDRKVHDHILVAWLLISALHLIFFYYDFNESDDRYTALEIMASMLAFISAPLLYLYVCSLVKSRPFRLRKYWFHSLPYLIVTGSALYFFEFGAPQEYTIVARDGFLQMRGDLPFHLRFYGLIMAFFSFLYPMISLRLLFKHRNRIESQFSYTELVNLDWLRYWIILSIGGFIVSFAIIWAGEFNWIEHLTSFKTIAALITLNISVIGFYGLKQTTIFSNVLAVPPEGNHRLENQKYKSSTLEHKDAKALEAKLESYMDTEKPFLDSQLSLESLALKLAMSKHELSQLINEQYGMNFFNFINRYRVEAFKRLLRDQKYEHYTLLGIALETGFNSKSSFNSIFKKIQGVTPSVYKQSLK